MNNILFIISAVVFYLYAAKKSRWDMQMFQQNSYMYERYYRWLKLNKKKVFNFKNLVPLVLLIPLALGSTKVFYIGWIVIYGLIFLLTGKSKDKLKLVFTNRVKRLCMTTAVLIALPLAAAFASIQAASVILMAEGILSFVVLSVSNLINKPIENGINRHYYNDAKRILRESPNLTIIGITGSYGKTSCKHILHKILSKKYDVLMTPGSFNTTMGIIRTVRENLRATHEIFIAEMGAKKNGDIKEICDLVSPKYGLLTSIGEQHLETFKTLENIKKTKHELIEAVPEDGIAFENIDDKNIKSIHRLENKKYIYYGIDSEEAHYRASNISFNSKGTTFDVTGPNGKSKTFTTKMLGKHNIYNILGGIAIASELGMTFDEISYGVKEITPVEHRLSLRKTAQNYTIIDDAYNSNPVGSGMALEVLKGMEGGKKILVTPGMVELGDKQYELNKKFGQNAASKCDYVILVGKKQTVPIMEGLKEESFPEDKIYTAANLQDALNHVAGIVNEGDVILLENDLPDTYNEA